MTPPSQWPGKALGIAITFLAIAVIVNLAVQILEAVLPFLLGLAGAAVVVFAAWALYDYRRSRW